MLSHSSTLIVLSLFTVYILTSYLLLFQDEDKSQSDVAEYEYGSRDSWDIRPKGRNRDRLEEETSEREEEDVGESYEPKLNGKQRK